MSSIWCQRSCHSYLNICRHPDRPMIDQWLTPQILPSLPSSLPPLLFAVPKKLLQEQGPRPPAYSPPPSAHDPNIVGDSPPEGSSVKRPDAVPGEIWSLFSLSSLVHTHWHTPSLLWRAVNTNQPRGLPGTERHTNSGLKVKAHTHVCIFKVTLVQLFPCVSERSHRPGHFMIISLENIRRSKMRPQPESKVLYG